MEDRTYRFVIAGLLTALPLVVLVASGMEAFSRAARSLRAVSWAKA